MRWPPRCSGRERRCPTSARSCVTGIWPPPRYTRRWTWWRCTASPNPGREQEASDERAPGPGRRLPEVAPRSWPQPGPGAPSAAGLRGLPRRDRRPDGHRRGWARVGSATRRRPRHLGVGAADDRGPRPRPPAPPPPPWGGAGRVAGPPCSARHMTGIDPDTEIPPLGLVRFRQRRRPPFIYSAADITSLMSAARRTIPTPLRAATVETIIGLLAATGMRIAEATGFQRGDLDTAEGVIIVRHAKFGKSRLVPLPQHPQRVPRLLQRLAQNHVIERLVRIIGQPMVDVALIDRHAAGDGALHLRARNLHAARIHARIQVLTLAMRRR